MKIADTTIPVSQKPSINNARNLLKMDLGIQSSFPISKTVPIKDEKPPVITVVTVIEEPKKVTEEEKTLICISEVLKDNQDSIVTRINPISSMNSLQTKVKTLVPMSPFTSYQPKNLKTLNIASKEDDQNQRSVPINLFGVQKTQPVGLNEDIPKPAAKPAFSNALGYFKAQKNEEKKLIDDQMKPNFVQSNNGRGRQSNLPNQPSTFLKQKLIEE